MKNSLQSIITAILAAAILTACGTAAEMGTVTADTAETAAGTDTVTAAETITSGLPETDLGGREFRFYVMGPERNPANYSVEIYAEKETGDTVNDAVFRRNSAVEEQYNFTIAETQSTDNNMAATMKKLIMAGDDTYQVAMLNLSDATSLVSGNMLSDLSDTAYIRLDKPWWDSVMAKELSINNKLYYAMGDINIMDNNATWAVFFNKKLITDYDMPSPYEDVAENRWTLERFHEYITTIARDLDGDGVMNPETDLWGVVGEAYNAYMLYIAAGERLSEKDESDLPVLTSPTARSTEAVEKIMAFMQDKERVINAGQYAGQYANVFSDLIRADFKSDHALFYVAGLLTFTLLRDMESEYGMVPMPKLDDTQDAYYTSLNYNNTSTVTIPVTNADIDSTSFVVEALAFASVDTLTVAYYDTALERKYMRDEESREMLDIILDSRVYDLMSLYNWGGIYGIFDTMVTSGKMNFASDYAAKESAAQTAIDKLLEELTIS